MAPSHVFISYSRQQFYFAESLASTLQRQQIPTWFDMEVLRPGCDWSAEIQRGLESCAGLVLIGSRAALTSDYVRTEWQAVLAAHKPVYIVLFEAVKLPPELRDAPVFDFRTQFDRRAQELAQSIQSGSAPRHAAPRANFLHLPLKMPWRIALIAAALIGGALLYLWSALQFVAELQGAGTLYGDFSPFVVGSLLVYVYGLIMCAWTAWTFVYRRFRETDLRAGLLALPIMLYMFYRSMSGLVDYLRHGGPLFLAMSSPRPYFPDQFLPCFLVVTALCWSALAIVLRQRSPDVLRWLPTGEASDALRQFVNETPMPRWPSATLPAVEQTYRLHYEPSDQNIATATHDLLERKSILHESSTTADVQIGVLTANTPRQWVENMVSADTDRAVCIAATSLHIPDDVRWMRRYQWVDYRTRSYLALQNLADALLHPSEAVSPFALSVVPESLGKLVAPTHVLRFANTLRLLAALGLAGGLFALFNASNGVQNPMVLLGLPIGVILFWLKDALIFRKITVPIFLVLLGVGWALLLLSGVGVHLDRVFGAYRLGSLNLMTLIYLGGPPLVLAFYFQAIRDWLPALLPPRRPARQTLTPPFDIRIYTLDALFVALALYLMLVMTATQAM